MSIPFVPRLGLQVGGQVFVCDDSVVSEVVQLPAVSLHPAAPDYVVGFVAHGGSIYTVLSPAKLLGDGAAVTSVEPTGNVGLIIDREGHHKVILAGERVVPITAAMDPQDWSPLELPLAFLEDMSAEPTIVGFK